MGHTRASGGTLLTVAMLAAPFAGCGGHVEISSGGESAGGSTGATQGTTTSSSVSGSGGAPMTTTSAEAGGATSTGSGGAPTTTSAGGAGGVSTGGAGGASTGGAGGVSTGGAGGATTGGAGGATTGGAGGATTGGGGSGGAPGPSDPTCAMGSVGLPAADQNMMSCDCAALGGVTIEGDCGPATMTATYRPDVPWTLCDVPSTHAMTWKCLKKSGGTVFACAAEQTTPCVYLTYGHDNSVDPYLVGGTFLDGEGNEWSLSGQFTELTYTGPDDAWLMGASFPATATRADGTTADLQITFGVCVAFAIACQI